MTKHLKVSNKFSNIMISVSGFSNRIVLRDIKVKMTIEK